MARPPLSQETFRPRNFLAIPAETADLLRDYVLEERVYPKQVVCELRSFEVRNTALWWYRYAPRRAFMQGMNGDFIRKFARRPGLVDVQRQAAVQRQSVQLDDLKRQGYAVAQLEAEVQWRLVAGIGTAHTFETNLTLHRLYGYPYLPGSSWKGMLRGHLIERIATLLPGDSQALHHRGKTGLNAIDEALARGEAGALAGRLGHTDAAKLLRQAARVFGSQAAAGAVNFQDALPINPPRFEADVMTPHVPAETYTAAHLKESAGEKRREEIQPNPVIFLTVGRRTRFRLVCYGRDAALVQAVAHWLPAAVENAGIGAKTAAGYGYLTPLSDSAADGR